jgi:Na+:H+ antiporter, NhaA family
MADEIDNSPQTHAGYSVINFIKEESFGGFLLIFVTIIAVIWANSPFYELYHEIWHEVEMGFTFANFELTAVLHEWVNDGLMAIFFFVIGLEIKREIIAGELSSFKSAVLPLGAAVGGMVVPALIYVVFNYNNPQYISGWGIPMATDIAFALGLMSILGDKVHANVKIFMTALAIADDLGAILVIAFFYTETIDMMEILYAFIFLSLLIGGNLLGVRATTFYAIIGFGGVWLSFMYSGVHATISGVLVALTIPAKPKITGEIYNQRLNNILQHSSITKTKKIGMLTATEVHTLSDVMNITDDAKSPSQKLEHFLHPFSVYLILPLFALANAGVHIEGDLLEMIIHPISLGIIAGLLFGKFIGITFFTKLIIKLKISSLPEGVNFRQIYGVALLAGIGFTMSIFVAELAIESNKDVQIAKIGIFIASIISAILGMALLARSSKTEK